MKYRGGTVDAERWDGTASGAGDIIDWWPSLQPQGPEPRYVETNETSHREGPEIYVYAPKGVLIVQPGDWIVVAAGMTFPCDPETFARTYTPYREDQQ